MKKSRLAAALMSALFLLPIASGCNENAEKHSTRELFAMDTVMSLSAYGERCEEATLAAEEEIKRLDALLSTGSSDSETGRINSGETVTMSDDTASLFSRSVEIYEMTGGAYDMSLYPLTVLWGFCGDNPAVPDEESIKKTMLLCGSDKIKSDGSTLTLSEGQGIDFGGIAKGYTSSRIMEIFKSFGCSGGIVSLGGNVQCFGTKPDGSLWRCGIADPSSPDDGMAGLLTLTDRSVITSGGYQRYFEEGNVRYHHIIDPSTGHPANSGLSSVTVISGDAALADGLSTACFVMGKEKSLALQRASDDKFELVLISDDGEITITKGLKDCFSSDREYSVAEG